jgi:hypothetical protein
MKRITFGIALMLLGGCAAAAPDQPPPDYIVGKYTFQDKGTVAKHPWYVDAVLVLERDAQYTIELNFNIDDDDEHETSYGTYRVQDNQLLLDPADESDSDDFNEFTIAGNRLTPKLGWGARLALKGLKVHPVFVKAE